MLTGKQLLAQGVRMLRGSKGERRHADVNRNAVLIAKIATVEDLRTPEDDGKDPAAVALGRKGGKARAEALGSRRRTEIARKAARQRWKNR